MISDPIVARHPAAFAQTLRSASPLARLVCIARRAFVHVAVVRSAEKALQQQRQSYQHHADADQHGERAGRRTPQRSNQLMRECNRQEDARTHAEHRADHEVAHSYV